MGNLTPQTCSNPPPMSTCVFGVYCVLRMFRHKEGADYVKITVTGGSTRTSFPLRPSFTVDEMT